MPVAQDELTEPQQLVLNYVRRIARMAQTAAVLAVAVIAIRASGRGEIGIGGTKIPVSGVWPLLIFGAFTVAHVYWTWFSLDEMNKIREQSDAQIRGQELLRLVRTDTGWFLGGLVPRTRRIRPGSRVVQMDLHDPTTFISYGEALLILAACLPWTITKHGFTLNGDVIQVITIAAAALAIVTINWIAGATWIVTLSQLELPRTEQWAAEEADSPGVWAASAGFVPQWEQARHSLRWWTALAAILITPLVVIFANR